MCFTAVRYKFFPEFVFFVVNPMLGQKPVTDKHFVPKQSSKSPFFIDLEAFSAQKRPIFRPYFIQNVLQSLTSDIQI
jgi:hypothetical protein